MEEVCQSPGGFSVEGQFGRKVQGSDFPAPVCREPPSAIVSQYGSKGQRWTLLQEGSLLLLQVTQEHSEVLTSFVLGQYPSLAWNSPSRLVSKPSDPPVSASPAPGLQMKAPTCDDLTLPWLARNLCVVKPALKLATFFHLGLWG